MGGGRLEVIGEGVNDVSDGVLGRGGGCGVDDTMEGEGVIRGSLPWPLAPTSDSAPVRIGQWPPALLAVPMSLFSVSPLDCGRVGALWQSVFMCQVTQAWLERVLRGR